MASQATLHQMMAFLLVYSRLPPLVLVPPLAIMAMPIMFFILNYFTDGHGHCAVLGIIVLWHSLAVLIKKLSRSPEKAEESLARNEFRLPFLSLFITLVFLKSITRFTGDALVYFPSTNTFTWGFVRLAIVTFLLEVATCLRYFSPPSISKCAPICLFVEPCFLKMCFSRSVNTYSAMFECSIDF